MSVREEIRRDLEQAEKEYDKFLLSKANNYYEDVKRMEHLYFFKGKVVAYKSALAKLEAQGSN